MSADFDNEISDDEVDFDVDDIETAQYGAVDVPTRRELLTLETAADTEDAEAAEEADLEAEEADLETGEGPELTYQRGTEVFGQRRPTRRIIVRPKSELNPLRQPTMTKFEKARLIGERARAIEDGAELLADFSRINYLIHLWTSGQIPAELDYADLVRHLRRNPVYLNRGSELMTQSMMSEIDRQLARLSEEFIPTESEYQIAHLTYEKGATDPTSVLGSLRLAEIEFEQGRLPLTVLRPMPYGTSYEYTLPELQQIETQRRQHYFRTN